MTRLLLLTDPDYPAVDRPTYGQEDLLLLPRLRTWADVVMSPIPGATDLVSDVDGVIIRNCGPVLDHPAEFARFVAEARRRQVPTYNSLDGRGDQVGKDHLLELDAAGAPVIPTSTTAEAALRRSPDADRFMVKLRRGADSHGQRVVRADELDDQALDDDLVVQPLMAISQEVSFVAIADEVAVATTTRPSGPRWALEAFTPSQDDLAFAQRFVDWNPMTAGVQRIDAMRSPEGDLLLMEVEDLNPFLSLGLLDADERARVVDRLTTDMQLVLTT